MKTLSDLRDSVKEQAAEQALSEGPSQVKEDPSVARTVGLVGACFGVFGIGMWLSNTYGWARALGKDHTFAPTMIYLWFAIALVGLLFHAGRDRDILFRRAYGLLGYVLLTLGGLLTAAAVAALWVMPAVEMDTAAFIAVLASGGLGLVLNVFMVAPFVRDELATNASDNPGEAAAVPWYRPAVEFWPRWLEGLKRSSVVQQATFIGVVMVIAGAVVGYVLVKNYSHVLTSKSLGSNVLTYGVSGLMAGMLFLFVYSKNEIESSWRDAAIHLVGVIGAIAGFIGLSSVATDWIGLQSIVLPYGMVFGAFIGLPCLGAYVGMKGSDSDAGYRASLAIGAAGLLVLVIAAVRSLIPGLARQLWNNYTWEPYLIPAGLLLMVLGGAYVFLGALLASDNRTVVLIRRELASIFYSPIAYAVIGGMGLAAWLAFRLFVARLVPEMTMGQQMPAIPEPIIRLYFWEFLPVLCLILAVPLVTMRLLSEEHRTGTMEVLLAAPVTEATIVLSKFFACLIFFMLAWGTWAVYPMALRVLGQESFDYRPLLSFYVGMAAMSAGFLSMGLFFSSLTRNQIVAALVTFAGMFILTILAWFMWQIEEGRDASTAKVEVFKYISYLHHYWEFLHGRVHVRYLLFHLSSAVFWLFLTVKVLEARKWR